MIEEIINYNNLGIDKVQHNFEHLSRKLINKLTIDHAHALLKKMVGESHSRIHTRTFLSSYVIKHFPSSIFEGTTNLEEQLVGIVHKLQDAFNQFIVNYLENGEESTDLLINFLDTYVNYINIFTKWKVADKNPRLTLLYENYCELESFKSFFSNAYNARDESVRDVIAVIDDEISLIEKYITVI